MGTKVNFEAWNSPAITSDTDMNILHSLVDLDSLARVEREYHDTVLVHMRRLTPRFLRKINNRGRGSSHGIARRTDQAFCAPRTAMPESLDDLEGPLPVILRLGRTVEPSGAEDIGRKELVPAEQLVKLTVRVMRGRMSDLALGSIPRICSLIGRC